MALSLKSRVEQIELSDTFNEFDITYRYNLTGGILKDTVMCSAKAAEGRHVADLHTSDGINFYGNVNQTATDDLSGLNESMKVGVLAIFQDPLLFDSVV